MKYVISIFFICIAFRVTSQRKDDNPLTDTKWNFIGLIYNTRDELHPCPENVHYIIHFKKNNEIEGLATVSYKGRYRIEKNNRIKIRALISKATPPGTNDAREFECRLNYSQYLGMGREFVIRDEKLKIMSSEYVTMLFELAPPNSNIK